MDNSTSTSYTTYVATSINTKSKIKYRGSTMCTKVKKAHENDVRSQVNFDMRTEKAYDENADDFKGYMALQDRRNMSILIYNCHEVVGDLKYIIWTDIMVFIMNCFIFLQVYMTIYFFGLILISIDNTKIHSSFWLDLHMF